MTSLLEGQESSQSLNNIDEDEKLYLDFNKINYIVTLT